MRSQATRSKGKGFLKFIIGGTTRRITGKVVILLINGSIFIQV